MELTAPPVGGRRPDRMPNRSRRLPWRRCLVGATLALPLAGCSDGHSVLSAKGPEAARVSALGWGMIVVSSVISAVVFGLLAASLFPSVRERFRRHDETALVRWGGVALPVVVLLALSGLTVAAMVPSDDRDGTLELTVVGHQYWWEVTYPGAGAVTANEIHIPAGRRVRVALESPDVIHSFWVPSLAGKIDMVPGRTNHLVLEADRPGTYRGQCAEYCGAQHARMAFVVVAQEPAEFQRWLRHQAEPLAAAATDRPGRAVFERESCAGCHTVRGTEADGAIGPDLTHLADRDTIGALTLPNDRRELRAWVRDAQQFKAGAEMPPIDLSSEDLDAIVDYLEHLR